MRPFLLAAAAFLALACNGSSEPPRQDVPPDPAVAFETIVQRSIPGQTGGEIREAARDQASWAALWSRLREGGGDALPAEPPAVDFPREMALGAAMPTQGCVSKVTIRSIARARGEVVVDLLEAPPAPNCICITSERPLHAVRLPRVEGAVRFVVEHGRTSCGS
jgi:hypothetical protein